MQIRDLIPWGRGESTPAAPTDGGVDNPMRVLQRDMNRVFDSFWDGLQEPFGTNGSLMPFAPRTDIAENEDAIEVTVELPGLEERDVEVALTNDRLMFRGEKKAEREDERQGYRLTERSFGSFNRSVPLPDGMDAAKASARFKNGVLSIHVPKSPEAQTHVRRIEVKLQ